MKLFLRFGVSIASGIGAAILSALIVVLADLYLTGHGFPSIRREIVSWEPVGVFLSAGDIGFLMASIIATIITWRSLGDGG